jgi:hypothetical protein
MGHSKANNHIKTRNIFIPYDAYVQNFLISLQNVVSILRNHTCFVVVTLGRFLSSCIAKFSF